MTRGIHVEHWTTWNLWKTSPSSVSWSRNSDQSRHSWRPSFWKKILQPSETQLAVELLPEGGCLVTGFRVFLGCAIKEVTSPPGGPFLGLTVDSPAHSLQDSESSLVIYAAPGLTQLHHITLHTAPGQAVCAGLSWQNWAQTHLPFPTGSPSWMSPFLSKPVCVPSCTPGLMTTWTSRDVLRHRWDKTWKIWESMSQAGSASSTCRFILLPFSYLSLFLWEPTVLFVFTVLECLCVCQYLRSLFRRQRNTAPKQWRMVSKF